jgi:hypothetical protein
VDPNTRRSRCGGTQGAWRLPQTTAASLRFVEHAPMHYDGGATHTPRTLHVPHCTPRATNGIEHRDHVSPQQTTKNTRIPPSLHHTQPRRQQIHTSQDQMAVTRSEREITAHMTKGTCRTRQGTRTAYILHTGEGGDTNPFPEGNNTKHKAHGLLDKGNETQGVYPRARGSGSGGHAVLGSCPKTNRHPRTKLSTHPCNTMGESAIHHNPYKTLAAPHELQIGIST